MARASSTEVPAPRTVADAELADRLGDHDVLHPLAALVLEPDRNLGVRDRLVVQLDQEVVVRRAGLTRTQTSEEGQRTRSCEAPRDR
jgi:hypothetical protein